jgi:hypothetical protein
VPAQTVDATPSNALNRQCFPGRSDLFGCHRSKPSQGSVPADLILASDLAFGFNARRVRPKCCVDPLRPPGLSVKWNLSPQRAHPAPSLEPFDDLTVLFALRVPCKKNGKNKKVRSLRGVPAIRRFLCRTTHVPCACAQFWFACEVTGAAPHCELGDCGMHGTDGHPLQFPPH